LHVFFFFFFFQFFFLFFKFFHLNKGDISELVNSTQKVESVLQKILQQKYYTKVNAQSLALKIFQRSLDKLGTILAEYFNTLTGLVANKQLERFLNNTNLRRKIEQLASSLLIESNILEEKYDFIAREVQSGGVRDDVMQQGNYAPQAPSGPKAGDLDVPIDDPDAKQMWVKCVGPKVCFFHYYVLFFFFVLKKVLNFILFYCLLFYCSCMPNGMS
jgi:hypothetical protein